MSFGSLSELERDVCLAEDVTSDMADAWTLLLLESLTPADVDRIARLRGRLQQVNEQMARIEVRMGSLVVQAARVRT